MSSGSALTSGVYMLSPNSHCISSKISWFEATIVSISGEKYPIGNYLGMPHHKVLAFGKFPKDCQYKLHLIIMISAVPLLPRGTITLRASILLGPLDPGIRDALSRPNGLLLFPR